VALEETHDTEEIIERIAALDVGKAELVCCVRLPSEDRPGKRLQEVSTHTTMTRSVVHFIDRPSFARLVGWRLLAWWW
jgi:transposase